MMLAQELAQIRSDLQVIKQFVLDFPEWIPLSDSLAKEFGYSTVDGLREYCKKNIHPSLFQKRGRIYHIHKSAIAILKKG
ncbi:hypothetical protein RZR97_02790 [Hydrogenimonas thermophila]|uniref:hypothetical protein n=1 Tax=Hydrogenimonas thermophila TaxID=223786 RepID=UPI0029372BEB|nr:hypothetical protein [Hydrogenimonas thermophila]WOE70508.1 hypothetical protein RZR91_02810 [Hydrogenimonas thermophila]WOE73024.1 hypothetical protein RZR97_02790 [Hydrogenimonas thermophila]